MNVAFDDDNIESFTDTDDTDDVLDIALRLITY